MDLATDLSKENPDANRLIFANNPILACAQLSFLLKCLSKKFRLQLNDLNIMSQKMQNIALNLQYGYRENNLYALYLKILPTGLTMLDYILQMGMKDIVETKFTKGLVLEFWDNESLITGDSHQISSLHQFASINKKFEWKDNFVPNVKETFSFEFGNVINSAKNLLFTDLVFLIILYGFLDAYIYAKIAFYNEAISDPNYPQSIHNLPPYKLDTIYPTYPKQTVLFLFVLLNYWLFFLLRTIHIMRQSLTNYTYQVGYISVFLFLTLTLLSLAAFPSYESQLDNSLLIKLLLVFTRTALAYIILTTMLGFRKSGETITIVATVTMSMLLILSMLLVYIIAVAEIMDNFFRIISDYATVKASFFTLVEILFGSIEFINTDQVPVITIYYTSNLFTLLYAYSSTILCTFLLIAYLSSIYEAVRQEASYRNTQTQYYYVQIYSTIENKGFYSFPPIIIGIVIPLLFLARVPKLTEPINFILLKIRFFMTFVVFQIVQHLIVSITYYLPWLYIKNCVLLFMGKANVNGPPLLHLVGWIFAGPWVIMYQAIKDLKVVLQLICRDFTVVPPREALLLRVTDDNVIYMQRYESLRAGLKNIKKENPDLETIPYLELLNYLMDGWKVSTPDVPRSFLIMNAPSPKQKLADLVRKHAKRLGGSKWLKSIYDAKKKFYKELIDGFLNFKTRTMKIEDATIDLKVALDMIQQVDDDNIVYLRARQIFSIQYVLLNTQSKEQISTMNKIEELEQKIDQLFRTFFTHFGENKDMKWSRVIDGGSRIFKSSPNDMATPQLGGLRPNGTSIAQ